MRYILSFLSSLIVNDLMLLIAIDTFRDSPKDLSKPEGYQSLLKVEYIFEYQC